MEWVSKECNKCIFNIDDKCRRFPPTPLYYNGSNAVEATYPSVRNEYACAEYKEVKDGQ